MAWYGGGMGYPPRWWGDRGDPRYEGFERARSYRRPLPFPDPDPAALAEEYARYQYSRYGRHLADLELRDAVRRSLYADTALAPGRIRVEVADAVVTLTGTVDDHLQARYAWDDAWETEGVRGVISELEVEGETSGADEEAEEEGEDAVGTG